MAPIAQAELEQVDIGQWGRDGLFWLLENGQAVIEPLGDGITWVVELLVDAPSGEGYLTELPWYVWPLAFALLGLATRRPTRGLRAAIALVALHTLGVWVAEDLRLSLSMTVVGVALGTVAALPVAIVAYASTGLRRAIRRVVDTALLIVVMSITVPLVFVFGLGIGTAVITLALLSVVPMTKALMLVVEHIRTDRSQAAQEFAAGLNTSLVLSVILQSSLALIGAGGLGRLLFRATNNLDLELHVTASLALLGLAVAFDQLTRPAGRGGVFLDRTHQAWALSPTSDDSSAIPPTYFRTAPPTVVGAAVVLGSLALPWSTDRGTITSHVREADLSIPGGSFNGIEELGGSGFGIAVGTLAASALLGIALRAVRRYGPPADFTTVISVAIVIISIAYLTTAAAPFAAPAGNSLGPIIALLGGLIMLLGTTIQSGGGPWLAAAASARLGYAATIVGIIVAGFLVVLGSSIGWVADFDPPQQGLPVNIEAEIDRLTEEAGDDINKQIAAAQEIQNLVNETQEPAGPLRTGGLHVDGPHTAFTVLAASGLAVLGIVIWLITGIERARWLAFGLSLGAALSCAAWITSTAIEHDPALQSDGGPFLALLGAAALAAIARRAPQGSLRQTVPETDPTPATETEPSTTIEIPDLSPV